MNHARGLIGIIAAFLSLLGIFSSASAAPGRTERIFALPELESPRQIVVEKGRVFFVDRRNIVVYDLSDGRFLKKIGKPGQGPGEFNQGPSSLSVLNDRLVIKDLIGSEIFNLEGVHESGFKNPQPIAFYAFLPVGRHFVGFPMLRGENGSLSGPSGRIYDSHLELEREFYGELPAFPPPPPPPGSAGPKVRSDKLLIRDYGDYAVHEDLIYVADSSEGFLISVFDENGILLREIRQTFEKVKVPKSFVDEIQKKWKAARNWTTHYKYLDPVVPEYFPALLDFKIDQGRICALTPARKGDLYEIIVMDLEGKILERAFRFPLQPNFETPFFNRFKYDIEGDELVWYEYDDDKETYELHIR